MMIVRRGLASNLHFPSSPSPLGGAVVYIRELLYLFIYIFIFLAYTFQVLYALGTTAEDGNSCVIILFFIIYNYYL